MDMIIENCHFVPKSIMKKAIQLVDTPERNRSVDSRCRRSLLHIQQKRMNKKFVVKLPKYVKFYDKHWRTVFKNMCWKAIYAHDWDKLLYLLMRIPPWEQSTEFGELSVYIRALVILLMYHKSSQAQGLLNEYLHLVWSARSVEDKKAVLKILLTLPKKITHIAYYHPEDVAAAREEKEAKLENEQLPTKYRNYFHES